MVESDRAMILFKKGHFELQQNAVIFQIKEV